MGTKKKYDGVVVPAVTPLTSEYKLDHVSVEKIFANFRSHGVAPFILGTTGEASSLPFALKKEFLTLAGKLKQRGDVLYAGISSNVYFESIALAKYAFDHGADVVVATLPSYYSLTEVSMLRYFEELAEAVDGRLMIYNIPATTHMSIPLEIADQLSKHHNIVGFKDSERNIDRMNEALKLWGSREDFSYFLGWAAKSADAILGGGDGLVPSTGNFHPALYQDLYQAARNGDETRARNFQKSSDTWGNLYQLGRTLGESLWALKVVMNEFGLCEPNVMPPIYAGSRADEKRIQETLQTILENQEINL